MTPPSARARSGAELLLAFSLLALGAALAFQKIRTFDYWWLLRTGQLIAETGAVPRVDPFSYTVPGARWIDIHWLFQLGLHGLYELGGHGAVVLAKVALVWTLLGALAAVGWRRGRSVVTGLALALMLLVVSQRLMPRPELPSFVLLAVVLGLLDRHERRGSAALWWVVPVQLLWVNLHGLFALGIALCLMALVSELVRPLVVPGEPWRRPRVQRLALVSVAAALTSLANPNFLEGALFPIQQLGMIGPPEARGFFGLQISELLPTLAQNQVDPLSLGAAAALGLLATLAMAINWKRVSPLDLLVLSAFGYLGLTATRNLALFSIAAAAVFVRNANPALDPRAPGTRTLARGALALALVTGLLAVDVARGRYFERLGDLRSPGTGIFEPLYPVGAAEWIARERPPGPICHHMADGGYLIWRLHPDYPVMVDGRLEVYGADRFADLQLWSADQFRALDREHRFGMVLVHYSMISSRELLWWLHLNSTWRLVFVDEAAALFVRHPETGTLPWPEVDLDSATLFPPLEGVGPEDRFRRTARAELYVALRRYETALALWEEALERHPDLPDGRLMHAFLLQRNEFPAAAEAIVRDLLAQSPEDPWLHAQVGELRFEAGDLDEARARFERALAIDPDLLAARLRLAMVAEAAGDRESASLEYSRVLAGALADSREAQLASERLAALGGPF